MKVYRVFVTSTSTHVDWFDIEADTVGKALIKADKAARDMHPTSERVVDEGLEVKHPGIWAEGIYSMKKLNDGIYHSGDADD